MLLSYLLLCAAIVVVISLFCCCYCPRCEMPAEMELTIWCGFAVCIGCRTTNTCGNVGDPNVWMAARVWICLYAEFVVCLFVCFPVLFSLVWLLFALVLFVCYLFLCFWQAAPGTNQPARLWQIRPRCLSVEMLLSALAPSTPRPISPVANIFCLNLCYEFTHLVTHTYIDTYV